MSPVVICFTTLDAVVIAQAAYAARDLRKRRSSSEREPAEDKS